MSYLLASEVIQCIHQQVRWWEAVVGLSGVQFLLEQVHSAGAWDLLLRVEASPLGTVLLTVAKVSRKVLHSRHNSSEKHTLLV